MTLESSPSHSTPLSHGGASGSLTTSDDGSCKSSDCLSLQRSITFIHCIPFVIQFLCLIVQQLLVLVTLLEECV